MERVGGAGGDIVHVCVREVRVRPADGCTWLTICTGDLIGLLFWSLGVLGDLLEGKHCPPEEKDKVSTDNSSSAPVVEKN